MKTRGLQKTRQPQQQRALVKVQRLVNAAHQCFNRHGYAATTMARIARTARVSTGTAYAYFADKDDLLQRVLTEHADSVLNPAEKIVRSLRPNATFRRTLERMMRKTLADASHDAGLHRVFHERIVKDPRLRTVAARFRERGLALGRQLVERFGGPCALKDKDAAAEVLVGLLEFCTHIGVLYPAAVTAERACAVGVDMLVVYFGTEALK
jgi:AcrR family transcriptional regulator